MSDESEIIEAAKVIAKALDRIGNGDAVSSMGAIEYHAVQMGRIADAIEKLTEVIREAA
jgi:hypothetical protein